ncbi:MAG: cytochrome c peroxidase [Candidatus Omnitrophota bacterium]
MKKQFAFHVCSTLLFAALFAFAGSALLFLAPASAAPTGTPYKISVPLGLPNITIPDDNPMTVEKIELGKMLYFDKRLSKDNTVACASCHIPKHGYAEPRATSKGIKDQIGGRNANAVVNAAYASSMFWDGRMNTLEEQAGGPVENPIEMGHDMTVVAKDLNAIPEYKKRFEAVFGQPASRETITKAIAAFERTILSGNSPYDKYKKGDANAISAEAKAGEAIFLGKGLCATCHQPQVFSTWGFYNAGVGSDKEKMDIGRMEVTKAESDKGAFRVPHLRSIADTAPYFHDGSVEKLEDAVRFMAEGGKENSNLNPLFRALKAQKITDEEIGQLTAFLKSLSGEYPVVEEPKLP